MGLRLKGLADVPAWDIHTSSAFRAVVQVPFALVDVYAGVTMLLVTEIAHAATDAVPD